MDGGHRVGERYIAPFVVAAAGILSVPVEPDIPGIDSFTGTSLFTSRWPREEVDLSGKAGRSHRCRIHCGAADSEDRARRRATRRVPAIAGLHVALVGSRPGIGRTRRDEGALR